MKIEVGISNTYSGTQFVFEDMEDAIRFCKYVIEHGTADKKPLRAWINLESEKEVADE